MAKVKLPDVSTIVAPVWDNPADAGLRAVVGDAAERARITFGPNVKPNVRAELQAALAGR